MKVVNTQPVLECTFREYWDEFLSKEHLSILDTPEEITLTLRGESDVKPKFRIPSADGQAEIFFDNRELLCRFANFPTPTQAIILRSIRSALNENKVTSMTIAIPWTKSKERKLKIYATGSGNRVLDFELQ